MGGSSSDVPWGHTAQSEAASDISITACPEIQLLPISGAHMGSHACPSLLEASQIHQANLKILTIKTSSCRHGLLSGGNFWKRRGPAGHCREQKLWTSESEPTRDLRPSFSSPLWSQEVTVPDYSSYMKYISHA
jgi:hypothetical protein